MGKKSRKKKSSGTAASSERGLPSIDCGSIDNTVCVVCNKDIDVNHWDHCELELLDCCGRILCNKCSDRKENDHHGEMEQLASLVLGEEAPPSSVHLLPDLLEIPLPPCPMCGTPHSNSEVEHRSRIRRLAEAGNVHAQYKLFEMLGYARSGIRKDDKAAFKWLQKAAEGGLQAACHKMGHLCHFGLRGATQSYEEAKRWYERAPESAPALHSLGTLYLNGNGVEKDSAKAREFFRQSAEHEYPSGLADYGVSLYMEGRFEAALVPLQKGALMEQHLSHEGGAIAHCQLYTARSLVCLHINEGSDSDRENDPYPSALFWARRAVQNGNEDAKEHVTAIEGFAHEKCGSCGKWNPKHMCSKCRAASYCDRTCQMADWKAGHKIACNNMPVLCTSPSKDECANCGKERPRYNCQGCGKASYCDVTCQRAHWEKEGGHKDKCKFLQ